MIWENTVFRGTLADIGRAYGRGWWRIALVQLVLLLGMSVVIGILAAALTGTGDQLLAWVASDASLLEARATDVAVAAAVAIAILIVPLQIGGLIATVRLVDRALRGSPIRLRRLATEAASRFLPVLGAVAISIVVVVAAIIGAPLFVVVGVVGLIATGVVALIRRRRTEFAPRWPGWRTWALVAIPFGMLWRVSATAILAPVAVVLEPTGPVQAFRAADLTSFTRRWSILGVVGVALAAAIALSLGGTWVGESLWGDAGAILLGSLVQFVALPIPIVAAAALYRRATLADGRTLGVAGVARRGLRVARTGAIAPSGMARTAIVTVVALVLSLGVSAVPAAAQAASAQASAAQTSAAGQSVGYIVTSGSDSVDAATLTAQRASCLVGGPDCTIRAALALAQQDAADGAVAATIAFAQNMTIEVVAPLTFAPDALAGSGGGPVDPPVEHTPTQETPGEGGETPPTGPGTTPSAIVDGVLTIDASGSSVVLDGSGSTQILAVTSEHWDLAISGVGFTNGSKSSGFGGALNASVQQTTLADTVFEANTAGYGGGAVFARNLTVTASSFIDNRASGWQSSVFGGAVRAVGAASIENSTFSGNGIGDSFTPGINRGSDVYADGGMAVTNGTFVNSQGGSLASSNPTSSVRNSIFTSDWRLGGLMCTGSFTGSNNASLLGDTTCPDTQSTAVSYSLLGTLDRAGVVPVFPLLLTDNTAIGAGDDCPSVDALGTSRPLSGCDLGAVEFNGATSVDLTATASTTVFGTVTFSATVSSASGPVATGAVVFTVDGTTYGPFDTDASGVAEVTVSDLGGGTFDYSAAFSATSPLDDSSAGPFQHTVEQVSVPVSLTCSNPTAPVPASAPECATTPWSISDADSIHLIAGVSDDRDGSVVIATDATGTNVVAGPTKVVDGVATFDVHGNELGLGASDLFAIYVSDDEQHIGASPGARPVMVQRTPVVTLSAPAVSAVFGDAQHGTVTITVAGDGSGATPTGTVTVFGHVATLDANGQASIDMSTLPVASGTIDLIAQYSGDAEYGRGASTGVPFETSTADTATTLTNISPNPPRFGEMTSVTVTVSSESRSSADPQGSVYVVVDGTQEFGPVTLTDLGSNGTRDFVMEIPAGSLTAGAHSVAARFEASTNFTDSATSTASRITVAAAPTTTEFTVTPASSVWGDQLTLTAIVDADATGLVPTGEVAFIVAATTIGTATLTPCAAPNTAGCAVAKIVVDASTVGIGTVALTADYLGADDFAESTDEVADVTVARAAPTVTVTGPTASAYGENATYSVAVDVAGARPADGTLLTITATQPAADPIALGMVTLINGSASITVPSTSTLLPGTYSITATFAGDEHLTGATGSQSVTITPAATDINLDALSGTSVVYGGTLTTTITVKNTSGALAPEGAVVLTWAGHEVGRATLSAADDTATPGERTVTIDAVFGSPIVAPDINWLTAEFVAAPGFADSQLLTDAHEERRKVTITPMRAVLSLEMTAVLGQPVTADATVTIPGDTSGTVPQGFVQFTINKSGGGSVGPFGAQLVDGKASLADSASGDIITNLAGTWTVYATFIKSDTNERYSVTSPDDRATDSVQVAADTALVTVTAPVSIELGAPLTVEVEVTGAVDATGIVRLQYAGPSNHVLSDEITLVAGRATISADLSSQLLALGNHDFVVYYSGNGTLAEARSADFTVTIGKITSTVTLSTSSKVLALYPALIGATVQYSAVVTATSGTPFGLVEFYRGTTLIGVDSSIGDDGEAHISVTPDAEFSGDISAVFVSGDNRMAGSTGTLAHSWIKAPVAVTLTGHGTGAIGAPATYTATVRFDSSELQFLPKQLRMPAAPSGFVTIADGAGATCQVPLVASASDAGVSTEVSSASCALAFTTVGSRTITATYDGAAGYASGTGSLAANVTKGTPTLTIATPEGDAWFGLTTVPVVWEVRGAQSGTVTIKLGSSTVCVSNSLAGSCEAAIPRFGQTDASNRFTLEYSGNDLWEAATSRLDGAIVACIPVAAAVVSPTGTAAVTMSPAPTCGDGTGYYTSDRIQLRATSVTGASISGISGLRLPFADDMVVWSSDRSLAAVQASPILVVSGGEVLPFNLTVRTEARCVPVTFRVNGITSQSAALNTLFWQQQGYQPSCGGEVRTISDTTVQADFRVGSTIDVSYQDESLPARTTFYGWTGSADDTTFPARTSLVVGDAGSTITASFGPMCYSALPTFVQPFGGTISTTLPASNCTDPKIGAPGWTYGTTASGQLVDSSTGRTFFDSWGAGTTRLTYGTSTAGLTADGTRTTVRPFTFAITDVPFTISASYGQCFALSTSVIGDRSSGAPGTASIATPSNCPIGTGTGSERWYRAGTSVSVTAAPTASRLQFLSWTGLPGPTTIGTAWNGLPITAPDVTKPTVAVTLNSDIALQAAFGSNANCRPLTINSVPAGALTLTTSFSLGENACSVVYGGKFYDQGIDGNGLSIETSPATADATGSEVVFAWTTSDASNPTETGEPISTIWKRSPSLSEGIYGTTQVLAFACQFVAISATVVGPDGTSPTSLGASNIDRATQSTLTSFVRAPKADCSTGSDPRSGYGDYAWVAGTQLLPVVVADPAAYRFIGWSGDASGTGDTPDAPVNLVGAGHRDSGDYYHARITARFEAICHTLTIPSDTDNIEVVTAPNCPGVDPSQHQYLGGTAVVLHANDKGDTLFRNWVSGTDAIDADTRWASVMMTSDKSVIAYYSAKSAGEQVTTYGTLIGDELAVASKKMVGFASAIVSAYVKTLLLKVTAVVATVGYLAEGLEYLGVKGSFIDGMKDASTAMNSLITMMFAPLDCITAWSAGGEDTAFFAAQNLIGTALISGMTSQANSSKPVPVISSLDVIRNKAMALKGAAAPVATAVTALASAKGIYDAAASGNIGWESSAYDAWGSQASVSVYTSCMANRMGGAVVSVAGLGG
ncbi:MAG: beta strand repeat-containing protein [Rhodoglobus sp.]